MLRVVESTTGWFGVVLGKPSKPKLYHAWVTRG